MPLRHPDRPGRPARTAQTAPAVPTAPAPTPLPGGRGPAGRVDGRTARRADTKTAILDAAGELFAAHGVSATSMDDIADHAHIAKGSLYYNFSSKSGLVEALIARSVERLTLALEHATVGLAGVAVRRAVVACLLAEVQAQPHAARLMATEIFRTDRDWRTSTAAWRNATMAPVTASYGDGADAGTAPVPTHLAALRAAALVGGALSAGLEWQLFRPELPHGDVLDATLQALNLT